MDIHYEILALINDEDDVEREQDIIDKQCDYILDVDIRLIEGVRSLETTDNGNKALMYRLKHIEDTLNLRIIL